ncbi:MAG: glycosyltransferase family 2 protein [Actinomycetota bacterium]|nr:glycosyltransferase family 2 protein [Actinomycetota bacterium]
MPTPDPVVASAEATFEARHGRHVGAPICVVIAAFDEAASVAAVVSGVPPELHGLATECLVVDDGSRDATSVEAERAGALVCRFEANRGQGIALRCGYRLATARRARVIVTMDADGQFDPADMAGLVAPVIEDRADLVQGSRRLGRSETTDPVRAAGVVVFATLISRLTGTRVTDPANGFRALRPEVPERVPLRQPQYQSSELLIGALALGYRVIEAPVTVRPRAHGASKKGTNLLYGLRFGRVVIGTWLRFRLGPGRWQPPR